MHVMTECRREVLDKLSPEEIASVVDAFYKCYGDGKAAADK